jgi:hypothetical protein
MNPLLKPDTILMDKVTGEIVIINAVSPLSGEDTYIVMIEEGSEYNITYSFVQTNTKHTRYEYIGEL